MSIDLTSRYKYTKYIVANAVGDDGSTYVGYREPAYHIDDSENEMHVVILGDTLESLAHHYFRGFSSAACLYWIIGEFQPTPILDPTLQLKVGSIIIIPAAAIVHELLYAQMEDVIV